ncbi:hypothetical protein NCS57_00615100 [Fusarium keratoplasticum]|uniref:Uncharacterized protein n=1 Tax=Fusarium keratoplasticum TaxID=1328300 RepID=A0ACC0R0N7_9HYPO|nr:hypothetical protein NCS57_00615100 [Fusarium keratoplasticum]KAI8671400.1 hypothetical protein NCS57_00615100 [Fusarium keratoplasticum]KAI8678629.1 hypothetical protein NCS55_00584400 [Fusarium keratoplasticum]
MAPAKTRKRKSAQDLPVETPIESSASDDSKVQHKLPVRAKDGDSAQSAKPASAPAKGTMMVFGDDDEITAPAPSKPAVQAPEKEEEEEESSDDEAPEAVSTAKVASDIKKSTQAAQKAAQEQAAAQKRKRRERDTLFKQQAEERKKLEDEAKVAGSAPAEPAESAVQKRQPAKTPNLLPAEFLTDSSSEDEGADEDDQAVARPRKRRVTAVERTLARQNRGPKDERVGSTVYRVAKKVDESMAPKLRKHARSSKELLLKRNRSVAKPRSGFLVK